MLFGLREHTQNQIVFFSGPHFACDGITSNAPQLGVGGEKNSCAYLSSNANGQTSQLIKWLSSVY